jgi:hypothetical protein
MCTSLRFNQQSNRLNQLYDHHQRNRRPPKKTLFGGGEKFNLTNCVTGSATAQRPLARMSKRQAGKALDAANKCDNGAAVSRLQLSISVDNKIEDGNPTCSNAAELAKAGRVESTVEYP